MGALLWIAFWYSILFLSVSVFYVSADADLARPARARPGAEFRARAAAGSSRYTSPSPDVAYARPAQSTPKLASAGTTSPRLVDVVTRPPGYDRELPGAKSPYTYRPERRQARIADDHPADECAQAPPSRGIRIGAAAPAQKPFRRSDRSLEARPPEVGPDWPRDEVYLLARVLPTSATFMASSPSRSRSARIAEPVRPDLGSGPDRHERIVGGARRTGRPFADRSGGSSRAGRRGAGRRPRPVEHTRVAVPDRRVQVPVGAELEHAAVVILVRLGNGEHGPLRRRVDPVGSAARSRTLRSGFAVRPFAGVVEGVDEAAGGVVRRKRDRQQSGFAPRCDLLADVEKGTRNDVPSRTMRTVPPCSTTKTRLVSPGGAVTRTGARSSQFA